MPRTYMQAEAQALARRAEIQTLNRAIWRRNDRISRLRRQNETLREQLHTALEVIQGWSQKGFPLPPGLEEQPPVEGVNFPPGLAELFPQRMAGPVRLTEADRSPVEATI